MLLKWTGKQMTTLGCNNLHELKIAVSWVKICMDAFNACSKLETNLLQVWNFEEQQEFC